MSLQKNTSGGVLYWHVRTVVVMGCRRLLQRLCRPSTLMCLMISPRNNCANLIRRRVIVLQIVTKCTDVGRRESSSPALLLLVTSRDGSEHQTYDYILWSYEHRVKEQCFSFTIILVSFVLVSLLQSCQGLSWLSRRIQVLKQMTSKLGICVSDRIPFNPKHVTKTLFLDNNSKLHYSNL